MAEELQNDQLIKQIQQGNELAFEALFLSYYNQLCKYIWKYVRSMDVAKETTQDVFADVWQNRKDLDTNKNLHGLLFTLAKNKSLDTIKHQKVVEKYRDEAFDIQRMWMETTERHPRPTEETFLNEDILQAIDELPPKARQIFLLNRKEGLTYKEIAAYLNISVKTVESQMSRALKLLRTRLSHFTVS